MSDITDMLADPDFKTGDYAVTRTAAPTLAAGVVTGAGAVDGSITTTGAASLQPASGETLKIAPEGVSSENLRDLWTTAALRAVPVPDIVTVAGEAWAVFSVRPWTGLGGTHYIVGLVRQVTP